MAGNQNRRGSDALTYVPRWKKMVLGSQGDLHVASDRVSPQLMSHDGGCSVPKLCPTLLRPQWTIAGQAPLSFTISQSLLKLTSIELIMPSNHLILCHPFFSSPQSFPASGSFPMCRLFASGGQSIGDGGGPANFPFPRPRKHSSEVACLTMV